jgi:Gpi18-like mannosyltransferase
MEINFRGIFYLGLVLWAIYFYIKGDIKALVIFAVLTILYRDSHFLVPILALDAYKKNKFIWIAFITVPAVCNIAFS